MHQTIRLLSFLLLVTGCTALSSVEYAKKPYRAMLYSAIVPGGGQIYTESYIKAALVVGVQAYLVGQAVIDSDKADKYKGRINNSTDIENLNNIKQRKKYEDELKSDYWWIGTTLFLSVADAFVDAHLFNFKTEKSKVRMRFEDKILKLEYNF